MLSTKASRAVAPRATGSKAICPKECKSEAGRLCLRPALELFGASLLSECEVLRLEAGPDQVQAVHCRWRGKDIALRGKVVVLAAGALMTPVLLQNSKSDQHPQGLANQLPTETPRVGCASSTAIRKSSRSGSLLSGSASPRFSAPIESSTRPARTNLNYSHVCGTCRFGDDPKTSVLDRNNRAHDVHNLYVVDASFFPSSAGINPSLTIAANALRVAESIHPRLS